MGEILSVEGLNIGFQGEGGNALAVRDVSFDLPAGEVLGIVGESGSGKSTLGLGLTRLLASNGRILGGSARFGDADLAALPDSALRKLRGDRLAVIFQNPMSSLNPTEPIGAQIAEIIRTHRDMSRRDVQARCIQLLELVGIPGARLRLDSYPHEFSGGMRQRVLIAMALALEPALLIADEPTTALDLTVQAQILWLLEDIQRRSGMSMLFITHNLAVAGSISHRIAVMYGGYIVENAPSQDVLHRPMHPYSRSLIASVPKSHWRTERIHPIAGQPPRLSGAHRGCPFAARCSAVLPICREQMPPVAMVAPGHTIRCFNAG